MSSDLFVHGDSSSSPSSSSSSLFRCSASDLVFPSDADFQFLIGSCSPNFSDHGIDLHFYYPHQNPLPADESNSNSNSNSNSVDQLIPIPELALIPDSCSSPNGFQNLSNFDVKNEESHLGFNQPPLCFDPSDHNNNNAATVGKSLLHRSRVESLIMESVSPNFPNQSLPCSESEFFSSQIRRVFSTGDLQNSSMGRSRPGCGQGSFSSPLLENGSLEEGNFKVGRYSAEERKERISKYRAKRRQRNFNKTIKYACRKTLADNRPRIRGRFARNDEPGDSSKPSSSTREEDEDDFWQMGRLHAGEEERTQYKEMYGQVQFQYCEF
ncbi:zinc finger protein CONSTANS-LIKE 9-like [Cucurbita maxima]|uniref:Zinc finger protein CONSTANS-LIKE 9-like n=1 Tax=Cucurbita maxima TaxID=3661 RepID=A0A6J1K0Z6_CUCMA|nr:zinc finger protein CONSTANS-LIKE 9-like [Cucurbita maxima]